MRSYAIRLTLLLVFMGLTGCATNRGIVHLQVPESTTNIAKTGKTVYIESVTDKRVFQNKPKTQDIPSLGFGGSDQATDEIKKRAIARKRNGYGQALGDILLEEGQTVETVIAATLKTAFSEKGYRVLTNKEDITDDSLIVTADIQKFWAYMTPGFWAITLSSDIATDLKMTSNGEQKKSISVHSEGKYQVASEANWMAIIDQSINKYISEVKNKIQ